MRRFAAIALLFAGKAAFGSPPNRCSLSWTATDATVTIAIPDGRTSFREGEVIPLALSFRSTADKRADNRNYDRSGRLSILRAIASRLSEKHMKLIDHAA